MIKPNTTLISLYAPKERGSCEDNRYKILFKSIALLIPYFYMFYLMGTQTVWDTVTIVVLSLAIPPTINAILECDTCNYILLNVFNHAVDFAAFVTMMHLSSYINDIPMTQNIKLGMIATIVLVSIARRHMLYFIPPILMFFF